MDLICDTLEACGSDQWSDMQGEVEDQEKITQ
jgi:hypothetical protein